MKIIICTSILLSALFAFPASARDCLKINENSTLSLKGKLQYYIFPAQPEYSDINKGDWFEGGYILEPKEPYCFTGFDYNNENITSIQLVNGYEYNNRLFIGKEVNIKINNLFPAQTGHHHAPLLGDIAYMSDAKTGEIIKPHGIISENRKIFDESKDITEEYGTPMPMIRAFYSALYMGRGDLAQDFIVYEKRNRGPYSISAMNNFYGNMQKPILLQYINKINDYKYKVKYNYKSVTNKCDGEAIVNITKIGDRNFIQSINSLTGC